MATVVPIRGVGVYHDSDTSRWHFDQLNDHSYQFSHSDYYFDLPSFLSKDYSIKFAGYHVPFPAEPTWLERFRTIYSTVNHSFVFCSELHERTVAQLMDIDLPNVSIFICGSINTDHFKNAKIYKWMDWFSTTTHFYSKVEPTLIDNKLVPQINKPKYFDILLGCTREHRDYVHKFITEKNLTDSMIMTYHRRADLDLQNSEFIFETDGIELQQSRTYTHTVDPVKYHGGNMTLSQVMPFTVYNETYYSLVAETNCFNHFNFYTEKIVKPLMAGRLFIAIAGQYYLKNLRKFGFKTFDSVIDESYDNEPNNEIRWAMALEQLTKLSKQNPEEICRKIANEVEHNKQVMLEHDWYNEFSLTLAQTINQYLTADHKVFG